VVSVVFRVFVASVLFAIAPLWILGLCLIVFCLNIVINKATGDAR
jgi:hypothetical protein